MEKEQNSQTGGAGMVYLTTILDDMWRGLKKFYWILLLIISVTSSLFYMQTKKSYSPVYQAYSSFVVNTKTAYAYDTTYYNKATASQMSKTFPYILTSGALNQVVAESLGLSYVPATITAEAMEDTALFTIKVTASDPQTAYDVLQAVIQNYPSVAEYII
ncbi:MAG: ABC transporter ATP-binding protein, partial [Lachnospiraceae bacterium]|nr:ABC transporter ATP-binding protein [Lachnospiraceae bacterium]